MIHLETEKIDSKVYLENGDFFSGFSIQTYETPIFGEVVFTTGMTGYIETLTDPSYAGQIVCFTYPLIGNYGVSDRNFWESQKIHASGVILSNLSSHWNHYQSNQSFFEWLKSQNVGLICNVDTRALTKVLRKHGTMKGALSQSLQVPSFDAFSKENLVREVSIPSSLVYEFKHNKTIYVIDCGIKENILRELRKFPINIVRVPYNFDFSNEDFDGVFISNGPGDPKACFETIEIIKKIIPKEKPIFGICLGIQLLALAIGADTYKLSFGHRGHNQPCQEQFSRKCYITSQNHGYAIDEKTLPNDWKITFKNLNDQTIAGIEHKEKPFFAVQFHPEATPGPTDTDWLFEKFYRML